MSDFSLLSALMSLEDQKCITSSISNYEANEDSFQQTCIMATHFMGTTS